MLSRAPPTKYFPVLQPLSRLRFAPPGCCRAPTHQVFSGQATGRGCGRCHPFRSPTRVHV